ncbi:MAG: sigma-70 family RNA polymerase sigma factor [Methylococcales bacterium]|nr:sigma-70 family RNA polymerase sigma factor [Methylococcales bacterium]
MTKFTSSYSTFVSTSIAGDPHLSVDNITLFLAEIVERKEAGLSQFYDQTINNVYGLALRITCQAEEAEEVVSDVYLQVWEQASRYQSEKGSIMAWLLTICRSRAIDRLRKRQKSNLDISDTECTELFDLAADPEYFISNTQQHSTINEALKKLSSLQRQLLSLAFFRGMTHQEIADFINMPLGTVKSHIRRSLIELKAELSLQYCFSFESEEYYG